jgi:hypothetical protein
LNRIVAIYLIVVGIAGLMPYFLRAETSCLVYRRLGRTPTAYRRRMRRSIGAR